MIDKDTLIKVTNRDRGFVGYTIPDLHNLHRVFKSGETKEVPMEELRKLCFNTSEGGRRILEKYLIIHNEDAVKELLTQVEPEYYYTDENVKTLLTQGTLAQLEDCLNFGTEGVINLVKKYAVELEINEFTKRQLIQEKTGLDVTNAIKIKNEAHEDGEESNKINNPIRKATPITETNTTSVRKTEPIIIRK